MKCPNCSTALKVLESPGSKEAPLRRCSSCKGIWLDKEVLEGAHAGVWANLELMGVDTVEFLGDYICPRCSAGLTAVSPHDHAELRIDRCGSCHGVWLDNGELDKLHRILADYEKQHSAPTERPSHWSMMKWVMYRMYGIWKGTYLG